jgi:putative aldouronate transport system substrate-binding protein
MKKRIIKVVALVTLALMIFSVFTGCTASEKKQSDASSTASQGNNAGSNTQAVASSGEKVKLTMFTTFPAGHAAIFKTLNDSPNMQAIAEATNVEVDILSIPQSNYSERKNLLFASGDLPDIIYSKNASVDALMYGINDDLIIPIDNLIKEHAPNFNKWVNFEPEIREQSLASDGKMYYLPYTDISLKYQIGGGYYIREAWLEQLNIEPPNTLDELYDVLKLFKEKDPAGGGNTIPLSAPGDLSYIRPIFGSFGTDNYSMYRINDEVKYGPIEPEFKEALVYLNKLYKENLIPSDYLTNDANIYKANLLNNIGITFCGTNSGLRTPLQAAGLSELDIMNSWRPISGMKGPDGKYYMLTTIIGRVTLDLGEFISSSNKYPAETMKWMDYKFSKEGSWTMEYGKKGVCWDFDESGVPYFTKYVTNNPDGLEPNDVLMKNGAMIWAYVTGIAGKTRVVPTSKWPYTYDDLDYNRTLYGPNTDSLYSRHLKNWWSFDASRQLPVTIKYTKEEQEKLNILGQDIKTLVDENLHKVIMGLEPIEKWDEVVNGLKNMKVDEYIAIYQAALDRVLN